MLAHYHAFHTIPGDTGAPGIPLIKEKKKPHKQRFLWGLYGVSRASNKKCRRGDWGVLVRPGIPLSITCCPVSTSVCAWCSPVREMPAKTAALVSYWLAIPMLYLWEDCSFGRG